MNAKHSKNGATQEELRPIVARLIERFGARLSGDALREAYYDARGLPVPPTPATPVLLHALAKLLPSAPPEIARHLKIAHEALAKRNYTAAQPALERASEWFLANDSHPSASTSTVAGGHPAVFDREFNALFAAVIRELFLPFLNPDADLHEIAVSLLERLEAGPLTTELALELKLFIEAAAPIALAVSDHARDLTRLVELMLRHLDNFVLEAELARQQVQFIRDALTRMHEAGILEEASERLEQLIDAQRQVIDERRQAEAEIRELLSVVIDRLASFSSDSGEYAAELKQTVAKVQQAKTLAELRDLLVRTVERTQFMHHSSAQVSQAAQRIQQELLATRERVEKLEQELRELSQQTVSDPLTGLMNRRGLEHFWAREMARAQRHHLPLSLAMLDLDNFKKFNDTFGHLAGDRALQHLAAIAKRYLRPQDGIARWGGEEFVIVLPDSALAVAERVIQRLQRELTKSLFFYDNRHHVITFSAGVAEWQGEDETLEQLIARADEALYAAKRAGKNRVVAAPLS
uniref:diguanylate cyclase n=1 Tax=uncultured beta proteobacterium TaxID=86027 RepID=H5SNZ4_9PROT|nr:GGDEF family protein [uncultured beta proteobacterium]